MRRSVSAAAVSLLLLCMSAGVALAAPPANDDIGAATIVGSLPFTDTISTVEATTAGDDPSCAGQGPTVWYAYTAPADQNLLADTFGSSYDTTLSAYTGSPGALTQVACNDDAGGDVQSAVIISVESGVTYYFMVGAFASGSGGNLVFNVDETDAQPAQMELTIDPTGRFSKSGSATISGTATCGDDDFGYVEVSLEQRVGRFIVRGFGDTFVECDGTAQPWSIEVVSASGVFKGGSATATVFGESCGLLDCAFDSSQRTVSLKR